MYSIILIHNLDDCYITWKDFKKFILNRSFVNYLRD